MLSITAQKCLFLAIICICLSRGLANVRELLRRLLQRNWWSCFRGEITPVKAIAYINSTSVKGTVLFTQTACLLPVTVRVSLTGLTPGDHGFHVHEKGDMSGGCASMLSHHNPDMYTHGGLNDKIRHAGDMGNIQANSDGVSSMTIVDHYLTLSGSRSIVGRGLVIHSKMDDLGKGGVPDSLTTGNSGSRIGCGVIGIL